LPSPKVLAHAVEERPSRPSGERRCAPGSSAEWLALRPAGRGVLRERGGSIRASCSPGQSSMSGWGRFPKACPAAQAWPAGCSPTDSVFCTMQACIFEYYQKLTEVPTFETERHAGGSPDLPFLCTLTCPAVQTPKGGYEECVFTAQGRSKKAAEHAASEKALEFIRSKGLLPEPVVDAAPTSATALKEEVRGRRPAMARATGCLLGPFDRRPPPVVSRGRRRGCGGLRAIAASGPTLGRCQALAGRRPAPRCAGRRIPPPMTHRPGRTQACRLALPPAK